MASRKSNGSQPSKRAASLAVVSRWRARQDQRNTRGGRCFHATKIRPDGEGANGEELEGGIEWVDATTGTFGLLGCTVWVDAEHRASLTWHRVSRGDLMRGALAKVGGRFRDGRFLLHRLAIKEPQAVIVDEIQGAITAIGCGRCQP